MLKISKDYKTEVENDEGVFKLAGAIVESLVSPIKFKAKCKYEDLSEYTKKRFEYIRRIKGQRLNFLRTDPLVRHWCDISGYSYTKVKNKILQFNK